MPLIPDRARPLPPPPHTAIKYAPRLSQQACVDPTLLVLTSNSSALATMAPVTRLLKPGVFAPIATFFKRSTEDLGACAPGSSIVLEHVLTTGPWYGRRRLQTCQRSRRMFCASRGQGSGLSSRVLTARAHI